MGAAVTSAAAAVAAAAEERAENPFEDLFAQARQLDAQMETMRSQYAGKVIVFHDGRVLCAADTEEEAVSRIPDGTRGLPLVIRRVSMVPMPDFMGGPKGE